MSLLTESMAACVRLHESDGAAPDGLGGARPRWTEGEGFRAALAFEGTSVEVVADRQAKQDRYTVIAPAEVMLRFHDVFRRTEDGAVFRVISSGDDRLTPPGAGLHLRAARAERWVLPE